MATRRNALGRGLGALIPSPSPRTDSPPPARAPVAGESTPDRDGADTGREIPVVRIAPNPQQPRREFDEAELSRLAASIERHGILQPVVVRRVAGSQDPGGERWQS